VSLIEDRVPRAGAQTHLPHIEVALPLEYKGLRIAKGYVIDLLTEDALKLFFTESTESCGNPALRAASVFLRVSVVGSCFAQTAEIGVCVYVS